MQILQRVAHLAHPGQRLGLVQRPAALGQQMAQVLALDEVHDQILSLAGQDEVVNDDRQVRMAQPRQQLRLALELAL